jgi:hypothetical protein
MFDWVGKVSIKIYLMLGWIDKTYIEIYLRLKHSHNKTEQKI